MSDELPVFKNLRTEPLEVERNWDLPLYLRKGYRLQPVRIAGSPCLLAEPLDAPSLATLRKQREQLTRLTGLECVLRFHHLDAYRKGRLVEDGIPFLVADRQVYLPFLALVLAKERTPPVPSTRPFAAATRRFILSAILLRWTSVTMAEAAKRLGVTRMTMSRCFDELDGGSIGRTTRRNRERVFVWTLGVEALWEAAQPHLASPVLRTLLIEDSTPLTGAVLGGFSALCFYSNLADNRFRTYATTRTDLAMRGWDALPHAQPGEDPGMIFQVLADWVPYENGTAVDPLTAVLSLTNEERQDPRVATAIQGILDEVLHD
jgi:hypothetical protein